VIHVIVLSYRQIGKYLNAGYSLARQTVTVSATSEKHGWTFSKLQDRIFVNIQQPAFTIVYRNRSKHMRSKNYKKWLIFDNQGHLWCRIMVKLTDSKIKVNRDNVKFRCLWRVKWPFQFVYHAQNDACIKKKIWLIEFRKLWPSYFILSFVLVW